MYRSKYEAYPFLRDAPDDLRCDFEILTDEVASMTGLLRSMVEDKRLREELRFVCETIYTMNPSLRTHVSLTEEELARLDKIVHRLKDEAGERCKQFVLPAGCQSGALSHVLRSRCKMIVRLLYRHSHQGHAVDDILFDFANLLSGYFFFLALKLNALGGVEEIPYASRNYSLKA